MNYDSLEPLAPALDVTMNTLDILNHVTNDDAYQPLTSTSVGPANALNTATPGDQEHYPTNFSCTPWQPPLREHALDT